MTENSGFSYCAEMGFTHKELINGLSSATEPYSLEKINDRKFRFELKNRTAELTMGDQKFRCIGTLKLPVVDVKIEFGNFTRDQYNAFIDRFKKYLHRGGG